MAVSTGITKKTEKPTKQPKRVPSSSGRSLLTTHNVAKEVGLSSILYLQKYGRVTLLRKQITDKKWSQFGSPWTGVRGKKVLIFLN